MESKQPGAKTVFRANIALLNDNMASKEAKRYIHSGQVDCPGVAQ